MRRTAGHGAGQGRGAGTLGAEVGPMHGSRTRPHARYAWLLAAGVACTSPIKPTAAPTSLVTTAGDEATPKPALPAREDLPEQASEVLAGRMMRHGNQMSAMMLAVVLLDYEVVRLLTTRMLDEPVLGRPAAGDDHSLNALLPASFFVHQDELATATRGLAKAATETDDLQLVAAFNDVSRTCVGCHSAYLHEALVDEAELTPPCQLPEACDEEEEPEESLRDGFRDL